MAQLQDAPNVFISYSWKPFLNKQKVLELAERLTSNRVHVIIDEWDLKEGQDKYQFMEQMVNNAEVKKVLLICNKEYAEKANGRKGGVGVESLIISDEIYKQADQTKFIPIVFEFDENGSPYLPSFVKSRIFIDLSNDEISEDNYEKLMRNIFDKPSSKRPPMGSPPPYITDNETVFLRTTHLIKGIKSALIADKRNSQAFIDEYYSAFLQTLPDFCITAEELKLLPVDEIVLNKIETLRPLRDDLVNFLDVVLSYSPSFEIDEFLNFLERLLGFIANEDWQSVNGYGKMRNDHFRFLYYEIFLYITAAMITRGKYKDLATILSNSFVIANEHSSSIISCGFAEFNRFNKALNDNNERLQKGQTSLSANLIKQRATFKAYDFNILKECDALLYYVAVVKPEFWAKYQWPHWFPQTSAYGNYRIFLLEKMVSLKYFNRIKCLFGVENIEELKGKISKVIAEDRDGINRWDFVFPRVQQIFNFDQIGTIS
jgi:hypothetical protein